MCLKQQKINQCCQFEGIINWKQRSGLNSVSSINKPTNNYAWAINQTVITLTLKWLRHGHSKNSSLKYRNAPHAPIFSAYSTATSRSAYQKCWGEMEMLYKNYYHMHNFITEVSEFKYTKVKTMHIWKNRSQQLRSSHF